jgi:hypothetical protein
MSDGREKFTRLRWDSLDDDDRLVVGGLNSCTKVAQR